ncbi:MAG: alpha/beta hydrolase, partial [Candidatus Omnitrophica bacterium]|nr:alpha/beta hydrolase [Candidatus Omnitrophota bacterium]
MKHKKNYEILRVTTVAICMMTLLLSGCSSLPQNQAKRYFDNLYKRIPYRQEGDHRVISLFYVTSRKVVDEPGSGLKFLPQMGEDLTGGILDAKIDPSLKIGKMSPEKLKSTGEIRLQSIDKVDIDDLADKIWEAIDKSPHKSLLVLVFGFKDDFHTTAIKTAYYSYMLDVNTPILLFDWPGDQPVSIGGYEQAQANAKESGIYFGEVLATIAKEIQPGDKIWIQASSLGCQVVCSGFEYMHENPTLADPQEEIDHVF